MNNKIKNIDKYINELEIIVIALKDYKVKYKNIIEYYEVQLECMKNKRKEVILNG